MSDNRKIRLATKDDSAEILGIYKKYIEDTAITFETQVPSVVEFRERMEQIMEGFPWIVCEMDGKIVGYAYASKHGERAAYRWSANLSIYVDDAYHREGIATDLYTILFEVLKLQRYHTVFAGVTMPNPNSEAFHSHLGFQTVGTFTNAGYKLGKWRDIKWFQLSLLEYEEEPKESLRIWDVDYKSIYLKNP